MPRPTYFKFTALFLIYRPSILIFYHGYFIIFFKKENHSDCQFPLLFLMTEKWNDHQRDLVMLQSNSFTGLNFTLRGTDVNSSSWFTCRSVLIDVSARVPLEMIPKSMILI